ncbi:hypothetical protein Cpap_1001 [Ruminiclostridium papyrosolvens DSM 2782]|uniref:Carrier domain-containing protein n=1 Tax=Ruminiclostridium papyrosolvens DSM 2782 TaxID=588581 RepID=F1TG00_9FIRM|nr:hypothetical protein [Ruminiclostridium papyrosolvens]EGD46619.1 hypothetical protein Cpap_1001 [Ruminiclostridium papyrosolvens DSM 2782]WES35770.1 hypothetical protein P0092_07325 [Ruminiclostridium papyrosolvens DSM 2782]
MSRNEINQALQSIFNERPELAQKIFGSDKLPENMEEAVIHLSSLDYVELIIELEERLNIESIPETVMEQGIPIKILADRIYEHVQQ